MPLRGTGERDKGPEKQSVSTNFVTNCNFKSFTITNLSNNFKKTLKSMYVRIFPKCTVLSIFFLKLFTWNSLPSAFASYKLVKQMVNC